jgi:DNA polymerase III subunit gamma/tau
MRDLSVAVPREMRHPGIDVTDSAPESGSVAEIAPYRVLARKYRPQTFADLIGQDAMVRTLTNAFATGRIAQAYMLTGVRGVGKTTTARLIARALNYTGPGSQSGPTIDMPVRGEHCAAILESRHVDVIEMDAASRTGVDDVRELIEAVRYRPVIARYKVYIIDEVHMLSKAAFNALLKTLEEPPPHVKFIFATTEIRKVPVTVLSRCQRFDLRRLDAAAMIAHLSRIAAAESVTAEPEALRMIARAAEGSVRDALSLLDQAIAHCGSAISAERVGAMLGLSDRGRIIDLFAAIMSGDSAAALTQMEAQHADGGDPQNLLADLADLVHWVTRLKIAPAAESDADRSEAERIRGKEFATALSMASLTRAWQMLLKGLAEVRDAPDALAAAEMVVIRLAYAADLPSGDELVRLARQQERSGATHTRPQERSPGTPASDPQPPVDTSSRGNLALDRNASGPDRGAPPAVLFSHFRDIVAFVGEKRDIKLKNELERYVRPVRVTPGSVEIALEPQAPPGLAGELARKLEAWTGQRWMISIANQQGEPPLREQALNRRDSVFREVRGHPLVQAVLDLFPGAEITDVRDPDEPLPISETSDNSEPD